jgi:hypothetical protein
MALQRELRQIIFGEGIDTRPDPNVLNIGKLRKLENGVFNKPGAIRKKPGSVAFGTASVDYPTVETIKSMFTYNGVLYKIQKNTGQAFTLPGFFDGNFAGPDHILSWSPTLQKWTRVSGCASIFGKPILDTLQLQYSSTTSLEHTSAKASNCVSVAVGGYLITVSWQSDNATNSNEIAVVSDLDTGAIVLRQSLTTFGFIKAIVFGGKAYIFGTGSGASTENLSYYTFDPVAMTIVLNATPIVTNLGNGADSTNNLFDICAFGSAVYLVYRTSTPSIVINSYTTLPASGAATVVNTATIAQTPLNTLNVIGANIGGSDRIIVSWNTNTAFSNWHGASYSTVLAVVVAAKIIDSTALTLPYYQIFGISNQTFQSSSGVQCLGFVTSQKDSSRSRVAPASINASLNLVTGGQASDRSLLSKPFVYDGQAYFFSQIETDGYYSILLDFVDFSYPNLTVIAKPVVKLFNGDGPRSPFLAGLGSVLAQLNTVSEPTVVGTKAYFGCLREFGTFNGALQYYPNAIEIEFDHPNKYQATKIGDLQCFNGGVPSTFDGRTFREVNWLLAPKAPSLVAGAAGALAVSSTYQVILVKKRVDAFGKIQLSEASLPASVVLGGAQNSITVTLNDWSYFPPSWDSYPTTMIFRTEANGTVFYLDQEVGNVASATLIQADSALISRELLYTEGGVLGNESATSCISIASFKERLFALSAEGLVHTKQVTDGSPPAFSSFFKIPLVQDQRWPTGQAALLDKLLIFFEDAIYFISGDGPNDTGDLGAFSSPQLLISGFGCIGPSYILERDAEVWFQSKRGWKKIDANLAVTDIGNELDYYITADSSCLSTVYIDRIKQIQICDGVRTYCWDTELQQWSILTTYNDTKRIDWDNKVLRLNAGVLYQEDPDSGKDGSSFVTTRITTGWIHLNNIQGFQRVYNAFIYGRYRSAHSIRVDVFYDGVPKIAETHIIDASSLPIANFSDANMYSNSSFAGDTMPYEFRIHLGRQKCQSVSFEISDSNQAGTGQSMDLVGLNIQIGLKNTGTKVRPGAQA